MQLCTGTCSQNQSTNTFSQGRIWVGREQRKRQHSHLARVHTPTLVNGCWRRQEGGGHQNIPSLQAMGPQDASPAAHHQLLVHSSCFMPCSMRPTENSQHQMMPCFSLTPENPSTGKIPFPHPSQTAPRTLQSLAQQHPNPKVPRASPMSTGSPSSPARSPHHQQGAPSSRIDRPHPTAAFVCQISAWGGAEHPARG